MKIYFLFIVIVFSLKLESQSLVWVETELFANKGGWTTDTQFIDQMGSPYLLAHGLGTAVADAVTSVSFPKRGTYHVWVRTKDWIPSVDSPGKFSLLIDGKPLTKTFGADLINSWHWEYGGTVKVNHPTIEIRLHDLTGFDGRCDVICFSSKKEMLPTDLDGLENYRHKYGAVSASIRQIQTSFDLVVAGGGVAGICAAVKAARLGLRVALINNRPVLGGNSSSEIKVSTDGSVQSNKYKKLGYIVQEIDNEKAGIGGHTQSYKDILRKEVVLKESNITLFENMHVTDVDCSNNTIRSLLAVDLKTLEKVRIQGSFFADCTGDAILGIKAGAEYRYGREGKQQTGERLAPDQPDSLVMGSSNQWHAELTTQSSEFPIRTWMLPFDADYHFELTQSVWNWESGFNTWHTVSQAEEIRDHNMRAIYSNWAYLKTHKPEKFSKYKLSELLYMTGKRESYRLMGDLILTGEDIINKVSYKDAVVTTTWGIDLHYPDTVNAKRYSNQAFIAYSVHPFKQKDIYTIPYRCFYSKNINNLFMAGRNVSVTHVALGAVRVQRCTGMMGEIVGLSSYLCKKNSCQPRDIFEVYLDELLELLK